MITYLLDTRQRRPIVMFYANKTAGDIVYKEVFDRAQRELGIKTIYTITDKQKLPPAWNARVGYISPQLIKDEVPDYLDCIFYISGPPAMVDSFKAALRQIHIKNNQIKTDFFAGLA